MRSRWLCDGPSWRSARTSRTRLLSANTTIKRPSTLADRSGGARMNRRTSHTASRPVATNPKARAIARPRGPYGIATSVNNPIAAPTAPINLSDTVSPARRPRPQPHSVMQASVPAHRATCTSGCSDDPGSSSDSRPTPSTRSAQLQMRRAAAASGWGESASRSMAAPARAPAPQTT